jgi:hypothetical protein
MARSGTKQLPTAQKILNASAALSKRGIKHACRKRVAAMCGLTKENKAFINSLAKLKNEKKFLVYDRETITINDDGIDNADGGADLGTNRDLLEAAKNNLNGPRAKQLLEYLFDGETKTRADVARHLKTEHTSKGFQNLLGPIRKLNYIEYVDKDGEKCLRMTDDLFLLGGRPDSTSSNLPSESKDPCSVVL